MKNFWSKWLISASSGILGRILLVVLCLGVGFVGGQSISLDKEVLAGAAFLIVFLVVMFLFGSPIVLPMILEWAIEKRNLKIESQKLENENLKLKLKLQQQEQQSPPDQEE